MVFPAFGLSFRKGDIWPKSMTDLYKAFSGKLSKSDLHDTLAELIARGSIEEEIIKTGGSKQGNSVI